MALIHRVPLSLLPALGYPANKGAINAGLVALAVTGNALYDGVTGKTLEVRGDTLTKDVSPKGIGAYWASQASSSIRTLVLPGATPGSLGITGPGPHTVFGVACRPTNTGLEPTLFCLAYGGGGQISRAHANNSGVRWQIVGGSITAAWGSIAVGDLFTYACRINSSTRQDVFLNGVSGVNFTGGTNSLPSAGEILFTGGGQWNNGNDTTNRPHLLAAIYKRALSDSEIVSLHNNWLGQLFEPRRIIIPVSAGAGGISGTLSQTLASLASSAAGTLTLSGTASETLSALTSAATGAIAIAGAATPTLAAVTSAAAGALALKGTTTQTLAALTLAGTGQLQVAGTGVLAQTLADASLAATGALVIKGAATPTLGALTSTATGTLALAATLSRTLDAATLSASGVSGSLTVGTLSATLADVTASATGRCDIAASLGVTLGDLTVSTAGRLQIAGVVNATLQAAALSAYETAATVVVEIYRASSPITTSRGMGSPITTSRSMGSPITTSRTLASTIDLGTP